MGMSRISFGLALASSIGLGTAAWPQDVDVNSFINTERDIALTGALANIGPNGTQVPGAHAGLVVASPSKTDPNCPSPP
jgi:glucoamylase